MRCEVYDESAPGRRVDEARECVSIAEEVENRLTGDATGVCNAVALAYTMMSMRATSTSCAIRVYCLGGGVDRISVLVNPSTVTIEAARGDTLFWYCIGTEPLSRNFDGVYTVGGVWQRGSGVHATAVYTIVDTAGFTDALRRLCKAIIDAVLKDGRGLESSILRSVEPRAMIAYDTLSDRYAVIMSSGESVVLAPLQQAPVLERLNAMYAIASELAPRLPRSPDPREDIYAIEDLLLDTELGKRLSLVMVAGPEVIRDACTC